MSNAIYAKPFTSIVEDVMFTMREANFSDSVVKKKYQRRVNDVYTRMLPAEQDFWDFLKKRGSFVLNAALISTCTATNASTTISYPTGGLTVNAYAGWFFTIPGTSEIYTVVSNTANTFTLDLAYQGASGSSLPFRCYQSVYELPADMSHMTTEPGFWYDYVQSRKGLDWDDDKDFQRRFSTVPILYPINLREYTELSSNGYPQVEIMPPVTASRIIRFEYFKQLPEMQEFSGTGTATTTLGSKTVTTSADYSASILPGQYFRIDSDGTFEKIASVSTTTITLYNNYPTSNTSKAFTVCDAPIIPNYMQLAIYFGACMISAQEQGGDPGMYAQEYKLVVAKAMSKQAKKRYGRQVIRFNQHRQRRRIP